MNHQPLNPQAFDLDALERELLPQSQPDVIDPRDDHQDIGRLSADAVLQQYKATAEFVASMGEEIQTRIRALDAALHDAHADLKLLGEAANQIREKGKLAHAEIERTSSVSKDIRAVVEQIKTKLA